jgi:hypothetical protein
MPLKGLGVPAGAAHESRKVVEGSLKTRASAALPGNVVFYATVQDGKGFKHSNQSGSPHRGMLVTAGSGA